jgi:hypothetical protein
VVKIYKCDVVNAINKIEKREQKNNAGACYPEDIMYYADDAIKDLRKELDLNE